jgi:geranylgeranyl diphosphate synthase type I
MALQTLQSEWTPKIEAALERALETHDFEISQGVSDMLRYHMGWSSNTAPAGDKGKRLRPLITLLVTGAFGKDPVDAMPGAVSIEFLHNFTLIHDDIEDRSPLRHGRPTIWQKWGIAQAINAGDALFSIAELSMLDLFSSTSSPLMALEAARELNQVCLRLICGQYLDLCFETAENIETSTYLEMIAGKTAALIGFAAGLGAMIAGQPKAVQDQVIGYSQNLGLAFQIIDDDLGIWGDPKITGKSAASDILARKKSLPVLYGLAASEAFRNYWQQDTLTPQEIAEMAELLVNCGAQDYVRAESARYTQQAYRILETVFPNPNEYAQALFELTELLLTRRA